MEEDGAIKFFVLMCDLIFDLMCDIMFDLMCVTMCDLIFEGKVTA